MVIEPPAPDSRHFQLPLPSPLRNINICIPPRGVTLDMSTRRPVGQCCTPP